MPGMPQTRSGKLSQAKHLSTESAFSALRAVTLICSKYDGDQATGRSITNVFNDFILIWFREYYIHIVFSLCLIQAFYFTSSLVSRVPYIYTLFGALIMFAYCFTYSKNFALYLAADFATDGHAISFLFNTHIQICTRKSLRSIIVLHHALG